MRTSLHGGTRPLGPSSAATLDRLTNGLGLPGTYGILMSHEIGDAREGASAVEAEYLGDCHFRLTRFVKSASMQTEDPEDDARVADPQVEFLRRDGAWFPINARSQLRDLGEQDVHAIAEAILHAVACEHELSESAGRRLVRLAARLWALVREIPRRGARS